MLICSKCNQKRKSDTVIATTSGRLICTLCINANTKTLSPNLSNLEGELYELSLRKRVRGDFFRTIEKKINQIETKIYLEKESIISKNVIAEILTSYPPDWSLRREVVLRKWNNQCSKCRRRKNLHIHHINHLATGGSNKLKNLIPLCYDCHAREHKRQKFYTGSSQSETVLNKRIKSIHEAILQGNKVSFGYKKGGEKDFTRRRVLPKSIVTERRKDGSSSVCVVGHCFLRNDKRQFALSKMRSLKILKS